MLTLMMTKEKQGSGDRRVSRIRPSPQRIISHKKGTKSTKEKIRERQWSGALFLFVLFVPFVADLCLKGAVDQ